MTRVWWGGGECISLLDSNVSVVVILLSLLLTLPLLSSNSLVWCAIELAAPS
uniref:Uncharacterized protein n=1 Tax=Octopus bimaculoides TaxID=37653 RepID=A0A0L8G5R1_OCTBM